jgi:hypothetical protein
VWAVLGLACLVAFVIYTARDAGRREALLANGVRTTGTILQDPPDSLRCGQVPVDVRFDVDGAPEVHTLYVGGCGGDGLSKGNQVTVWYDPSHPADFVTSRSDNERPLGLVVAVVAFVAGSFLMVAAGIRGRRLGVVRRVLRSSSWRVRPVRIASVAEVWTRGRLAVLLLDDEPPRALLTQPSADWAITALTDETLHIAGDDGWHVIASAPSGKLVRARTPRANGPIRRVEKALARVAPAARGPTCR